MSPTETNRLAQLFSTRFGTGDTPVAASAPGRVNLLGEHTDYHEGYVLPATVPLFTTVWGRRRTDGLFRLYSENLGDSYEGTLPTAPQPGEPAWARYVLGVAHGLKQAGIPITGADLLVSTALPIGSGLSSSAALEIAAGRCLLKLRGREMDPATLARIGQTAEHDWAGVPCGLLDQMAVSVGQPGHALLMDCRSLTTQLLPIPASRVSLLVCHTGHARRLAETGYRERRAEGHALIEALQRFDPALQSLRDVSATLWTRVEPSLSANLRKRGQHVLDECQRVQTGVEHLRAERFQEFGALMFASHESLATLYEVSTPLLDRVVETLKSTPGVWGAKLTGAGFGGSVVALVAPGRGQPAAERLQSILPDVSVQVF